MNPIPTEILIWALILTAFIPFAASLLILLTPEKLKEAWGYIACFTTFPLVVLLYIGYQQGSMPEFTFFKLAEGLELKFRLDALGLTFAFLASALWILAAFYTAGYARDDNMKHRARFLSCFAAAIGSAIAIAYSSNVLTMLLFYEVLTITTYPLVAHKEIPKAFSAARRYLFLSLGGGLCLTAAAAWTWMITGSLEFEAGGFLAGHGPAWIITTLMILFMLGTGVKAAIMPAHSWLPAAMVAPTPVSALLHAVAVVKAGVFGCIRVLGYILGPEALDGLTAPLVLQAMCAITIIIGSLIAVRQDNLKKRLAYSTICHLSYIVLGASLLSQDGFTGAVLHMVNHGLAKITLFFCAGAIYVTAHYENISQMKGLGKKMPWTMGAFTVASLGLIGVPGMCGFISKLYLCKGAIQANEVMYIVVLLGGSLFTASYLLPVIKTAFFDKPDEEKAGSKQHKHADDHGHSDFGPARLYMRIPLMITATLVIIQGFVPFMINAQFELASEVGTNIAGITVKETPNSDLDNDHVAERLNISPIEVEQFNQLQIGHAPAIKTGGMDE